MADAADSKSVGRKAVWVRLPPPAYFFLELSMGPAIVPCLRLANRKDHSITERPHCAYSRAIRESLVPFADCGPFL